MVEQLNLSLKFKLDLINLGPFPIRESQHFWIDCKLIIYLVTRGRGVLPYLGYAGTCRWTGYGFLASLS